MVAQVTTSEAAALILTFAAGSLALLLLAHAVVQQDLASDPLWDAEPPIEHTNPAPITRHERGL